MSGDMTVGRVLLIVWLIGIPISFTLFVGATVLAIHGERRDGMRSEYPTIGDLLTIAIQSPFWPFGAAWWLLLKLFG